MKALILHLLAKMTRAHVADLDILVYVSTAHNIMSSQSHHLFPRGSNKYLENTFCAFDKGQDGL